MIDRGTIAYTLRPPDGFESLYEGVSVDTPIPLVPQLRPDIFAATDPEAGKRNIISSALLRYTQVGRDASLRLVLPRLYAVSGQSVVTEDYEYQLHWRFRQLLDSVATSRPRQYTMVDSRGVPDTSSGASVGRELLISCQGAVIIPVSIGDDDLPLIAAGVNGAYSQGVYDPGDEGEAVANADTFYEPVPIVSRADELGITVRRVNRAVTTTWSFTGADAPFSNYFGTDRVNAPLNTHAVYPSRGVYLFGTTSRP